jgi:hypothetical protein
MSEEQQEKAVPTKEEIIAFIKEQIEVKSVQLELQELNTGLAVSRAEELKALAFIAQMTQPGGRPEGVPHTITQEDLDNNPELVGGGFKVGDEVIVPNESPVEKQRTLKKNS